MRRSVPTGSSSCALHRGAGCASHRLSANAQLQCPRAQPPARPRGRATDEGDVRRGPAQRPRFVHGVFASWVPNESSALEVDDAERQRTFEAGSNRGGFGFLNTFSDLVTNREANELAARFVHEKIRGIVRDPELAERLCPTEYPFGTKRLCVDTNYYATYNRDNVTLIDLRRTPIEEITPQGLRTREREIALDAIVFATGFDAMTGAAWWPGSVRIAGRRAGVPCLRI